MTTTEYKHHNPQVKASRQKSRRKRKACPIECQCMCHDVTGGPFHHGQPCPGKSL